MMPTIATIIKKVPLLHAGFCKTRGAEQHLEQHEPTALQRRAKKEGLIGEKILLQKYQLLRSEPTDNLMKIEANYIYLKSELNNRRYYIPDKKKYLLMLDQCYEDILALHQDYNYLELGRETGIMSKREAIQYELKAIKNAELIAILQTYESAALLLIIFIIYQIYLEEINTQKQQYKLTDTVPLFAAIRNKIRQHHEFLKARAKQKQDQVLVPRNVEAEILKAGMNPEDTILADGILRRKQKEAELKEKKKQKLAAYQNA